MGYEADKVVVELIAKVGQFDQTVKQSASTFEASADRVEKGSVRMTAAQFKAAGGVSGLASAFKSASVAGEDLVRSSDRVSASAQRTERSVRAAQMASRNLGYQISDIGTQVSMGTSPFIILAQQGPQVANALEGARGAVGRFAGFLSGPWGAALLGAITILGVFLSKHKDTTQSVDDLVEKLKEHHEKTLQNNEAQQIFDRTIEGSIEVMKKLTDEITKQNLTLGDNIQLKKAAIAAGLADVTTNIGGVSADLAKAIADMVAARNVLNSVQNGKLPLGENAGAAITAAQDRFNSAKQKVAELQAQLQALTVAAEQGASALGKVDFPLIEQNAKDAIDPISAINHKYDEMAAAAKQAGTYTQKLADSIEKQRAAAIKAAQVKTPTEAEAISAFKAAVIGAEGTGKNPMSSAKGFDGFIAGTWLKEFDRVYPQFQQLSNDAKLALRDNKQVAEGIIDAYARENAAFLKGFGATVTTANLYLAHVLGASGAKRVLQASADTPVNQVVSAAALAANPFIGKAGTAGGLQREIARRIGDSSSAVSQGVGAVQQALDQASKALQALLDKGLEITTEFGKQLQVTTGLKVGIMEANAAEAQLKEHVQDVATEMDAAYEIGSRLVDDVLNPDNWDNWGSAGKRILHDLEAELFRLAAINPLKNLLFGSKLPSLSGILGLFGGGGGFDAQGFSLTESANATALGLPADFFRAAGGPVSAGKSYVVGEDGPEIFTPTTSGTIIPNSKSVRPSNDRAMSPYGAGAGGGELRVWVSASEYFDTRVQRITGPMVIEGSTRAAHGGSLLARQDLAKSSMHTLD